MEEAKNAKQEGGCCSGSSCAPGACGGQAVQVGVQPVALSSLLPGQFARVCEACLDADDAAYLRAMGLRPDATIRVCRQGEPCVVEVLGSKGSGPCGCDCATRIGLARALAGRVMVRPRA